MISIVQGKPGQGMTLRSLPTIEPSIVPSIEQERIRLLLAMSRAADFYDLCFTSSEHTGYVRGLWMGMQISSPQLVLFQAEAGRVFDRSADRLTAREVCA